MDSPTYHRPIKEAEMNPNLDQAIAAARVAHKLGDMGKCDRALGDLLAALDAARGQAVAWVAKNASNGKFGYVWHEEDDVRGWIYLQHQSRDDVTWKGPIALYAAPPAAAVPDVVQQVIEEMLAIAPTCENDLNQQLGEWVCLLAAAQGVKS